MSDKTIFKKIIDGEIPADVVHDDEHCLAFKDINPQAPLHLLVIPKKEITSMQTLADDDLPVLAHICGVIRDLAAQFELRQGYRVVVNSGSEGGQDVPHLHFHLLGGRQMSWPPG